MPRHKSQTSPFRLPVPLHRGHCVSVGTPFAIVSPFRSNVGFLLAFFVLVCKAYAKVPSTKRQHYAKDHIPKQWPCSVKECGKECYRHNSNARKEQSENERTVAPQLNVNDTRKSEQDRAE